MRQIGITALILAIAISFVVIRSGADEPKKGDVKPENKLVGTWKLVSGRYGGQEFKYPEGTTMVKHVTPTHFMWATYDQDGNLTGAAGGPYTLKGETYEETPEYGIGGNFDVIKGKPHTFKWKVDGIKWYHDGKLNNGLTIEEVWDRAEMK